MLLFYRYVFYRIYSFFERVKSTNAYNTASLIMILFIGITTIKLHLTISKFFFGRKLEYSDMVTPYLLLSLVLYAINYILLIRNLKYLKIEDVFIQKQYPKYFDRLFIGLGLIIPILLII